MAVPARRLPSNVKTLFTGLSRTSSLQNQDWKLRKFFKFCVGKNISHVWKQIVQNSYQRERQIVYPAACILLRQSACFTHSSSLCGMYPFSSYDMVSLQFVRHKSGGKKSKSSSSSSDEDTDLEDLDDDDYEAPARFKKMKIYLKSLRADSVVSSALDISRNRVDEIFYGSRLRLNGEKLLKKSKQMEEGDYVDLVVERSSDTDQLLVKRVKVMDISSERTIKDKTVVTVKVWKSPFPVEDASKAEWKQDD